jgi:hypothetical protein
MGQIQQPATGGVDINYDIDATVRQTKIELLNGGTVVKSATVSSSSLSVGRFQPQRWRQQPTYRSALDTSNPITNGIIHAGTPYHGVFDAVDNVSWTSSSTPAVGSGRAGLFWLSNAYQIYSATSYSNSGQTLNSDYQSSLWVVSVEYDSYTGTFAQVKGPSGGDNSGTGIGIVSSGKIVYQGSTKSIALDSGTLIPLKQTSVIVFTSNPAGSAIYLNGSMLVQSATALGFSTGYYKQLNRLGYLDGIAPYVNLYGVSAAFPVFTYGCAQWVGACLTDSQAISISQNPWQIFRPVKPKFFSLPGTSGTTGTINVSSAELSGVTWPWTPTVRITSQ